MRYNPADFQSTKLSSFHWKKHSCIIKIITPSDNYEIRKIHSGLQMKREAV